MSNHKKDGLKLIGTNEEDLEIISAYLQDSVVVSKNIVFLKQNRNFIMVVNRFMWENVEKETFANNKRIKCAIKFEEVIEVKSKNINQKNNDLLECLAVKSNLNSKNFFEVNFFFSGGGVITLTSEVIEVYMNDLGKPWKVKHLPTHEI